MDETAPLEHLNPLQRFGRDVRRVRLGRKLTQKHLGRSTGYSDAYVSKVESGALLASEKFAHGCDVAFGTHGLFAGLLERIDENGHPSWFLPYLQMEAQATHVLDYSPTFIMGMLQTEEYARSVLRAGSPRASAEVLDGKVAARVHRHAVMEGERPPLLWVVFHEGCLRTLVGGSGVMSRQFEHLVREAENPHITLQILPFEAGTPATGTPFTLLKFQSAPTVLHVDGPQGGRPYDSAPKTANALETFDRLRAQALSPEESLSRLATMSKENTS